MSSASASRHVDQRRDRTACPAGAGPAHAPRRRPRTRWATSMYSASSGEPCRDGDVARPPASRANPCRPTARRRRRAPSHTASASPSSTASFCASVGVPGDHAVHVVAAVQRELDAGPHPLQRGLPGTDAAHHRHELPEALAVLVVVLRRLQVDVVAEPLRLLVGVGVAADADQQRRVVDAGPVVDRRARPARPAGSRSGTAAARAPSVGRSRDRCRATARRRAPPTAGRPIGPALPRPRG